jgi:hypothetical protein
MSSARQSRATLDATLMGATLDATLMAGLSR